MKHETSEPESTVCPDCGSDICLMLCAKRMIDDIHLVCGMQQDLLLAYRTNHPELGDLLETVLKVTRNWRDQVSSQVAFESDEQSDSVH